MTTVTTEAELQSFFRDLDRDEVELAPELTLPFEIEDARAWAVGPRVFLVFCDRPGARPRGIVFHRNAGGIPDVVAMCDWCHAMRAHAEVKLLSVRADERRRVGMYLCSDLRCASESLERIREFAARRIF